MVSIKVNKLESFSVVLPAYNEQANIEMAINQVRGFATKNGLDCEIIVVDDGSKDKTAQIVKKLALKDKKLNLIRHSKNRGYGAAVYSGLKAAKGDLIFFTDSDLQFDIAQLGTFLKRIKGYDAVFGYRPKRSEGFKRKLNMLGWKVVTWLFLGLKTKDLDCAFKLFRKETLEAVDVKSQGATFSAELTYNIKKKGFRILELPVKHFKRRFGCPTGSNFKVIERAFSEMYSFYLSQEKLVRSRSTAVYILAIVALFLSRLLFMSSSADFFDSNEYITRTGAGDLLSAIGRGHPPFHPLYLLFSNVLFRILHVVPEIKALVLTNVICGSAAIVFAFLLVKQLISSRAAWLSAIFYALIPFVFISHITILVDPSMQAFYFISLYLFALSIKNKTILGYLFSLLSGIALSLSALSHTQIAFWVLGFVAVLIFVQKKLAHRDIMRILLKILLFSLFALTALWAYSALLINARGFDNVEVKNFGEALRYLLLGNVGDRNPFDLQTIIRYLLLLPTSLITFLAILGTLTQIRKKFKYILALLLWAVPGLVITSSYIYENLHGRAMMIGLFPLCILASMFILNVRSATCRRVLIALVILQLLAVSIPAVIAYRGKPAAFEQLATIQTNANQDGAFVFSNVSRTWHTYTGSFVNFGDVDAGSGVVWQKVEESLLLNKPVYLSSDAIMMPYRRYDGKFYDIRSTGTGGPSDHSTILSDLFNQKNVSLYKVAPDYRLAVYSVKSDLSPDTLRAVDEQAKQQSIVFGRVVEDSKPISMLAINLFSPQWCNAVSDDLSRLDLGFCLWRTLGRVEQSENWSYTDRDGWFFVPTKQKDTRVVVGPIPSSTRSDKLQASFPVAGGTEVTGPIEVFDSMPAVAKRIEQTKDSFYVKTEFDGSKVRYNFYSFKYELPTTNKLEAEQLSGQVGGVARRQGASGSVVRTNDSEPGYLLSGPYINLPKGKYELSFNLQSQIDDLKDAEIEMDVNDSKTNHSFFSERFNAKNYQGDEFKEQKITFEVNAPAESTEFRMRIFDKIEVNVDYLTLNKI